ncbi:MAG: zinc ABC transporter substrate-binding protein [Kiritimatiellae bacterium]|nr:zinc ABC transporter substrate-binding protein [Kiritimatiellia bacterium]
MRSYFFSSIVLMFFAFSIAWGENATETSARKQILCTTFPMYQITRNVAQGSDAVEVQLLLPASLGCPHNYALTPQDMQKLGGTRVLIVNGLGLEEFLGAPVQKANADLVVVDSSSGIKELLQYHDPDHDHDGEAKHEAHEADKDEHESGETEHEHHHSGTNPHLFASPRMAAHLAGTIAAGLARVDPDGAELYKKNAAAYVERMNKLAQEFAALGKTLKNNRIVTQHGVFDYLARDTGLEIVAVVQAHAGQEPSAAEMLDIVKTVRANKAGAVFTEPQYPAKVGGTLAKETGIPCAVLDPVATGPENAPPDYYETIMRKNMEVLRAVLGAK